MQQHFTTLAPPIVRCTRCGGWLTASDGAEAPTVALTCAWCAEEFEVLGGRLVAIARPASGLTDAALRRERHALTVAASTQQRREAR